MCMEIALNTNIFTQEEKVQLKPKLEKAINDLAFGLDIASLKKVIIPSDFTEEIISFQIEHGKKERGHTKTENEDTIAKVMYYIENEEYFQVIFIHENCIAALISIGDELPNDIELAKRSCHYIRHELGHVHDEFQKRKIYSEELRKGEGLDPVQFRLTLHSDIVWSEYFANRTAAVNLTSDIFLDTISYTFDLIDRISIECREYISKYRLHGDISLLLQQIEKSTSILFYFTAHSFGYLHYFKELSKGYESIKEQVEKNIFGTYYKESWILIDKVLNNMFSKYPNWNDIYELEELNGAIHLCWNRLGIYLENDGGKLYVSVP